MKLLIPIRRTGGALEGRAAAVASALCPRGLLRLVDSVKNVAQGLPGTHSFVSEGAAQFVLDSGNNGVESKVIQVKVLTQGEVKARAGRVKRGLSNDSGEDGLVARVDAITVSRVRPVRRLLLRIWFFPQGGGGNERLVLRFYAVGRIRSVLRERRSQINTKEVANSAHGTRVAPSEAAGR